MITYKTLPLTNDIDPMVMNVINESQCYPLLTVTDTQSVETADMSVEIFLSRWAEHHTQLHTHSESICQSLSQLISSQPCKQHLQLLNQFGVEEGNARFIDMCHGVLADSAIKELSGFIRVIGQTPLTIQTPSCFYIHNWSLMQLMTMDTDTHKFVMRDDDTFGHLHTYLSAMGAEFYFTDCDISHAKGITFLDRQHFKITT